MTEPRIKTKLQAIKFLHEKTTRLTFVECKDIIETLWTNITQNIVGELSQAQRLMETDLTLVQRLCALESEVAALVREHQATRDRILSATSRLSAVEHEVAASGQNALLMANKFKEIQTVLDGHLKILTSHTNALDKLTKLVEMHEKGE